MGKKITREQAVESARRLLAAATHEWRYEVVDARFEVEWTIVFAVYSPAGAEVDGPVVVTVDGNGSASLGPSAL